MGTSFLYMAASATSRFNQRPYVLGGLAMLWGWIKGALAGKPRYADAAFRTFLRRYQRQVLLVGKRRAIETLHRRHRLFWIKLQQEVTAAQERYSDN